MDANRIARRTPGFVSEWVAAATTEELSAFADRADSSYLITDLHAAVLLELDRRKYIKTATQDIDPELGFTELLNVL